MYICISRISKENLITNHRHQVLESTDKHIFAIASSRQPGVQFQHNWDNVGLCLTESGSVKIDNVRLPWSEALGWDPIKKEPIESILKIPYTTLLLPT